MSHNRINAFYVKLTTGAKQFFKSTVEANNNSDNNC